MANSVDLKLLIKHLSNGTLGENLCIICLKELDYKFENIFTKICVQDNEFCVADVLEKVAKMKFTETDNYNVCIDCFNISLAAHKFYLLSSRSNIILNYYCDELEQSTKNIDIPETVANNLLFLSLPTFETQTTVDFNTNAIGDHVTMGDITKTETKNITSKLEDDNVIVFVQENGVSLFCKLLVDGSLVLLDDADKKKYVKRLSSNSLTPKKDKGVKSKECGKCSMKCTSLAELKEHMRLEHSLDLFVCKVCNATIEDDIEYYNHMLTHTNVYQCAICRTVFRTRDNIISHLKWHEDQKNETKSESHICEICGIIKLDKDSLRAHYDNKHKKCYTCYYCGRLYKYELSFDRHINKHEAHIKATQISNNESSIKQYKSIKKETKHKCMCSLCGRCFVDDRALMWHQRLHNNERPFTCDICGRSFVSLNRRNQHALCAHTAPTRRCPLCPAMFHLRSMVNTHVKKVHLNSQKRRHRTSKYKNEYWKTEPVPIQELSIDIQNDIIALKAAKEEQIINSTQIMQMEEI